MNRKQSTEKKMNKINKEKNKAPYGMIACGLALVILGSITAKTMKSDTNPDGSPIYKEGVHYSVLENPIQSRDNEVIEYFWYGCPHCYAAEPVIRDWSKDASEYKFTKRHSQLNSSWMADANMFYAMQGMGRLPLMHNSYFNSRQSGSFRSEEDLYQWIEGFGIKSSTFLKVLEDESLIERREKHRDEELSVDAGGVPTFVVGGEYLVDIGGLSSIGGWEGLPGLFEYLLEKDSENIKKVESRPEVDIVNN